jgi:hypothetical protein
MITLKYFLQPDNTLLLQNTWVLQNLLITVTIEVNDGACFFQGKQKKKLFSVLSTMVMIETVFFCYVFKRIYLKKI